MSFVASPASSREEDPRFDSAPAGLVSFADDGRIFRANARLAEWLGRTSAELEAATFDLLLTPGSRVFYQTHFFPLLKLQGAAEEIYLSLRHVNGDDVPVLINALRRDEAGGAVNECAVVRTRQRDRFEEQILLAKNAAEAASEVKSRFLSMMSHELRTPLQSIAIFSELLAAGHHGPTTERQREDVDGIKAATQNLVTLIDDILNFARLESGAVAVRLEKVSPGTALVRAESLLRPRLEEAGIAFSFDGRAHGTKVNADPDRLQQILLNLLTNAIKFTRPGGQIRVDVEAKGAAVLLHVRDTGSGIPEDQRQRIFDPFVQIDRERVPAKKRGVGLGLSISRELARAMGGDLTVESEVGQGSVFTISLLAAE
ncbi:MAG: HAMP domain-containing histidine kinase [Acidobacteria bacterium]|nr:HAMP domain-containing histidine kinase [Acidobacteriota bacterium]